MLHLHTSVISSISGKEPIRRLWSTSGGGGADGSVRYSPVGRGVGGILLRCSDYSGVVEARRQDGAGWDGHWSPCPGHVFVSRGWWGGQLQGQTASPKPRLPPVAASCEHLSSRSTASALFLPGVMRRFCLPLVRPPVPWSARREGRRCHCLGHPAPPPPTCQPWSVLRVSTSEGGGAIFSARAVLSPR